MMWLETVVNIPFIILVIFTSFTFTSQDLQSSDAFQPEHQIRPATYSSHNVNGCRDIESRSSFMSCIMDNLNNWAWNLLKIRQSLAHLECEVHSALEKCLHQSRCTIQDAVRISTALTELLTYNNHSGTFLHSFLALGYACSTEGQAVLKKHAVCLRQGHEGFYMMKSVDEINDRYLESKKSGRTETLCSFLKEKVDTETANVKKNCQSEEAAMLVCKTIAHAFTQIDPAIFGATSCEEFCRKPESLKVHGQPETAAINGNNSGVMPGSSKNETTLISVVLLGLFLLFGKY